MKFIYPSVQFNKKEANECQIVDYGSIGSPKDELEQSDEGIKESSQEDAFGSSPKERPKFRTCDSEEE